ncbi:MAG: hypothetical protein AAGD00_00195 [Planctomycetota bacterium]
MQKTRTIKACVLAGIATIVLSSAASAQGARPQRPDEPREPSVPLYLAIGLVFAAAAVGLTVMPSKRTHQD